MELRGSVLEAVAAAKRTSIAMKFQIKKTATIFLVLLVGSPVSTCLHLWATGHFSGCRLTYCPELLDALDHAAFTSSAIAFGWLFMQSPFASRITQILETKDLPDGEGQVVTKVKITEPSKPEEKS